MPRYTPDPSPDDRRREVARLLAAGLLRYHRRARPAVAGAPAESQESPRNGLDVVGDSRLNAATRAAGERTRNARDGSTL